MTSRIVNRVPLLRTPERDDGMSRLLADVERWGGFDGWIKAMLPMYGDALFDHTQKVYGDFAADWAVATHLKPFYPQQEAQQ